MIAIIDSGIANLRSVEKALVRLGVRAAVIESPDRLRDASGIILPGVGAFADGIAKLRSQGFVEPLRRAIERGTPLLGICLGLHFLFSESEEFGHHKGMDLIPGRVVRFGEMHDAAGARLKVPHMGWNTVRIERRAPIFRGLADEPSFYFVHSYYVQPADETVTAGTTEYGVRFASAIWRDNVFATQFHPEKSQAVGLQLLGNFAALCR
ncbi:MAG TPA: imidazole glycerol phosphate synthase subunit HisH [Candidatus Baltobacteraceae bacterium]|jgi:imidazole glycerol-phosphate synthase subunit HisH|nr:imidazole glycerol phosphate synthase subunit HisH [Candidatus Baltobacteraceae bacterium]